MTEATKRKRQVVIDSSSSSDVDFNISTVYDSYRAPTKIISSDEGSDDDAGNYNEKPPSDLSGGEESDVAEKCDEMRDSVHVSDLDDTDVNKTVDFEGSWSDDEDEKEQENGNEKKGSNAFLTAKDLNGLSASEGEPEHNSHSIADTSAEEGIVNNYNDQQDAAYRLDESLIEAGASMQRTEICSIVDTSPILTSRTAQNVTYIKSSPSILVKPVCSTSDSDGFEFDSTQSTMLDNASLARKSEENDDCSFNMPPNDANVSIRRHTRRLSSNTSQQKVVDMSPPPILDVNSSEDEDFPKVSKFKSTKPIVIASSDTDSDSIHFEGQKPAAATTLTTIVKPKPAVVVASKVSRPKPMTTKLIEALPLFDNKENAGATAAAKKTDEVVANVHSALTSAPAEDVLTDTPKHVRVELMPHQKHGLSWLLWRELQNPPSGILGDDMGLGKTLSIISLIVEKKNRRLAAERSGAPPDSAAEKLRRRALEGGAHKLVQSNATLIVAPASLIYQWEKEVKDRVKTDFLSIYVFHGTKKQRDCPPRTLARNDIVITTYQTLASELSERRMLGVYHGNADSDNSDNNGAADVNSPNVKRVRVAEKRKLQISNNSRSSLALIAWERVVLDEAHQIKNRKSLASRAVCRLASVHRWCLTGTPIHNELWDLYSLIRFLHVKPFDEEKMWQEYIMASSNINTDRLNTLVKSLLLRRTKQQTCQLTNRPILDLGERRHEIVMLELKDVERRIYDLMFAASKQKVRDLLNNQELVNYGIVRRRQKTTAEIIKNPFLGGSREINANDHFRQMSSVLTLLLRLRQACVHMYLTRSGIDLDAFRDMDLGMDGAELAALDGVDSLEEDLANMSLVRAEAMMSTAYMTDEEAREQRIAAVVERVFEPDYMSTKVEAALARLTDIINAKDKWYSVIVSQWTTMLNLFESHLRDKRIKFTSITGKVETKDRQERVDSFNRTNGGAQVMLLSLTAGGVGLNLVGGNHLFLLDLHWNPALEQQACDRIYRIGQRKNVFIHKFLCNCTIEQRVLDLQEKKSAMAKSVLEGAAKKSKLTMADLKFLFDLDNRAQRQVPTRHMAAPAPAQLPPKQPSAGGGPSYITLC